MNPGDIVLIRFPQTDLQVGKLRPALVLAVAPGRHSDLLLALISSQTHQAVADFDEILYDSDPDFTDANLKVSSVVRIGRLATVDSSIINARLGRISPRRLETVLNRLTNWLSNST